MKNTIASLFIGLLLIGFVGCQSAEGPTSLKSTRTTTTNHITGGKKIIEEVDVSAEGSGALGSNQDGTYSYSSRQAPKPLPWFLTLSASGEKIQLVSQLNQQVLDTDAVFLKSMETKNANFEMLLDSPAFQKLVDRYENQVDELEAAKKAKEKTQLAFKEFDGERTLTNADAALDAKAYENELTKKKDEIKQIKDEMQVTEKMMQTIIANNVTRIGQRFTAFNLRPAAVVAAERNPSAYAQTENAFLGDLDLGQVAVVAGTVIEPAVIAIGIVDSITKRIIKKDGDTEMHYISIPIPYNFDDTDEGGSNSVNIVASNNGKYEYHLNGSDISSAQDGEMDYASMNKIQPAALDELSAAKFAAVSASEAAKAAELKAAEAAKASEEAVKALEAAATNHTAAIADLETAKKDLVDKEKVALDAAKAVETAADADKEAKKAAAYDADVAVKVAKAKVEETTKKEQVSKQALETATAAAAAAKKAADDTAKAAEDAKKLASEKLKAAQELEK